jgi:glycosyltransferase involved in cell wall biosynthesis
MKILCLIDSLGSGGAQRQMVTLAKLLKEKDFEISFLVYHNDNFFIDDLRKNNIPIEYCAAKNYLDRILKVRKYIRKNNFDAVISFLDVPNFLNNISAIGGKKWKVITSERSSKENSLISLRGKIFNFFQRYSDYIVCNSENARKLWLKHYPQYKNKLVTIYNPVILPEVKSQYLPRKDGKLHFVVAASYQYLKNPIGLIKALALMNNEERKQIVVNWYGNKEVSLGGTKPYEDAMSEIKKNKLESVIHLNSETKEIANLMNEADVIAIFSEYEGLPNVICEGMMIGKPIIMTKVSDYSILVDESNGFLCEWDNPKSIKDAIQNIVNLPTSQLVSLGKASKIKAENLFSPNKILNQWLDILN